MAETKLLVWLLAEGGVAAWSCTAAEAGTKQQALVELTDREDQTKRVNKLFKINIMAIQWILGFIYIYIYIYIYIFLSLIFSIP